MLEIRDAFTGAVVRFSDDAGAGSVRAFFDASAELAAERRRDIAFLRGSFGVALVQPDDAWVDRAGCRASVPDYAPWIGDLRVGAWVAHGPAFGGTYRLARVVEILPPSRLMTAGGFTDLKYRYAEVGRTQRLGDEPVFP